MIVVRNSFIAKPGQAGKLAAHLKEMAAVGNLRNARVLTAKGIFFSLGAAYPLHENAEQFNPWRCHFDYPLACLLLSRQAGSTRGCVHNGEPYFSAKSLNGCDAGSDPQSD